jgi:hypothetical protein
VERETSGSLLSTAAPVARSGKAEEAMGAAVTLTTELARDISRLRGTVDHQNHIG